LYIICNQRAGSGITKPGQCAQYSTYFNPATVGFNPATAEFSTVGAFSSAIPITAAEDVYNLCTTVISTYYHLSNLSIFISIPVLQSVPLLLSVPVVSTTAAAISRTTSMATSRALTNIHKLPIIVGGGIDSIDAISVSSLDRLISVRY
jgi:hypothetical protein